MAAALGLLTWLLGPAARGDEAPRSPRIGAAPETPFADPQWRLTDIDGGTHQPWGDDKAQAAVLVFIGAECPVSNYYQPTLRGLERRWSAPAVRWYFIHTDPSMTVERARLHARNYSITAPVVLDPRHELARAAGAIKLPQAAVIARGGAVAYLGRIDDTYAGFGKRRAAPSRRDLDIVLGEVTSNRPVTIPRTESVGCFIPFARPAAH